MATNQERPVFNKEKHIRYWLMNFKTYLPTAYQSMDSNRMFLAFMTVCSLDVLGILHASGGKVTDAERAGAIEWIYACQHPDGGFRAFLGTDFGSERRNDNNGAWDPANIAGTFFALASLIVLRDDMKRVERRKCLEWLCKLQAADGSFAEILGPDGRPAGRRDVRYSYLAAALRYVLALPEGTPGVDDIDRTALANFVLTTQAFDGGLGEGPNAEPQGGFVYCGAMTLLLLGVITPGTDGVKTLPKNPRFLDRLIQWSISRQVHYEDPPEEDDEGQPDLSTQQAVPTASEGQSTVEEESELFIGFNGRCNKPADTCYSFWVGATLCAISHGDLLEKEEHQKFLLERTQYKFGGFGKWPGDLPDMMHSCLGLFALKLMGYEDLEDVDPVFCMTASARRYMEQWREEQLRDATAPT